MLWKWIWRGESIVTLGSKYTREEGVNTLFSKREEPNLCHGKFEEWPKLIGLWGLILNDIKVFLGGIEEQAFLTSKFEVVEV